MRLPLSRGHAGRLRRARRRDARTASHEAGVMKLKPSPRHSSCRIACVVAACTNGGGLGSIGGGGTPSPFPSGGIGVGIPTGKIGVENDPTWGTVSGYTQNQTSQVLAFPPGSKITVKNLSKTTPHTLNVVALASGPPPHCPPSPSLSFLPERQRRTRRRLRERDAQPGKHGHADAFEARHLPHRLRVPLRLESTCAT